MLNDCFLTGLPRINLFKEAHAIPLLGFIPPPALMVIEAIFIDATMAATRNPTPYLNGSLATNA
jgi:hypothetical protein